MNIKPRSIPKFEIGGRPFYIQPESWISTDLDKTYYLNQVGGLTNGTISNNGLTLNSNRNNIYFNGDWNNYHNWHSENIVLPWLNKLNRATSKETDWENLILNTLNSWNDAGGFQWLNATPELRQHGMLSAKTKIHLNTYYNNPLLKEQDNIIGQNLGSYIIPDKANSADHFVNGTRIGRNGAVSDTDFGILTGNRRPTIHINSNEGFTKLWDEYYKGLGYVGKYKYLDHWVPTRDLSRAEIKFNDTPKLISDFKLNIPDTIDFLLEKLKSNRIPIGHLDRYGFDWGKLKQGALKLFSNPDLWATARLAGNLINNERVYGEALKGIKPVLRLSYHTHRQVVGDEATKQAYYRRAAQGLTKAARPFTSDADRQMAYLFEAKRIGDELRAQGDLADNQEIRRTSDESNQHQWANTLRDTEVANANLASINLANSLRHNLLALKHSAQWSSVDNYLQGIEYRKRLKNAELQALDDLIFTLQQLLELANDPRITEALKAYQTILDKHKLSGGGYDMANDEVIEAKRKYQSLLTQIAIEQYLKRKLYYLNRGNIFSAKSGTKVTYKKKDDLLYKSTKDVVEHFRKMSKISSDALNRKTPKIEKLTSHPKGKTKKYLLGGVAPFTVYKPVALGGETTTSTQTGTSSTKSSSEKEGQDLLKELFKALQVEGLPSDVNGIFQAMNNLMSRRAAFGQELSTEDIASMYLLSMQQINNIKFSKALFDAASKSANDKDAILEYAVDSYGRLAVLDKDGKISFMKWNDIKDNLDKYNPLTNNDLLNLRAYSPDLAFNSRILEVVNNGIGISKIAEFLKELLPKLGSSEQTIEGYTKLDSNMIIAGLKLLKDAPAGDYKMTLYSKDLLKQALMALSYLASILPNNMKSVLLVHAGMLGISTKDMLLTLIGSQMSEESRIEFDAVTGKASDKDKEGDLDKLGINSATQLLLGMSSPREFTFSIGNGNMFNGMARVSSITKDGNPVGADFAYSDIYKSDLHKNLDLDNASFGDVPINKALKDRIIIDNSTIAGVDLPYTIDRNGRIIPDFKMLNRIEEADLEILKAGINPETEPQKVNEIYAKHNLPIKYGADNRLTGNYKRFAVILATAIEDVFLDKSGLASNGTLSLVSDENEINKYINEIKKTTGEKDIDMDRDGLWTGNKEIFKGSIFIPIIGDLVDAVSATGGLKAGNYDELRSKYLTKNYNEAPLFVKQ